MVFAIHNINWPQGHICLPPQYSCQENPMDRGARWAMVYRVTKNRTQLKQLSKHAHMRVSRTLWQGIYIQSPHFLLVHWLKCFLFSSKSAIRSVKKNNLGFFLGGLFFSPKWSHFPLSNWDPSCLFPLQCWPHCHSPGSPRRTSGAAARASQTMA